MCVYSFIIHVAANNTPVAKPSVCSQLQAHTDTHAQHNVTNVCRRRTRTRRNLKAALAHSENKIKGLPLLSVPPPGQWWVPALRPRAFAKSTLITRKASADAGRSRGSRSRSLQILQTTHAKTCIGHAGFPQGAFRSSRQATRREKLSEALLRHGAGKDASQHGRCPSFADAMTAWMRKSTRHPLDGWTAWTAVRKVK